MRKFHKVAVVVAAIGSLTSVGAATAAACPQHSGGQNNGHQQGYDQPAPSQQTQSQTQTQQAPQQQAPQQQAAPQQAAPQQQAPQQAPQQQAAPQQQPAAQPQGQPASPTYNNNRAQQECSPQTLLELNAPIAVLDKAETHGFSCAQNNPSFNQR